MRNAVAEARSTPPTHALLVWLLVFASGAAALGHQVIWTRRMVDVLGASAGTFAKVVGAFFIGLALGGAWSAWRPRLLDRPWRAVAVAETTVAFLALPILLSVAWLEHLPRSLMHGAAGKFLLPLLLVTPPAVAMGLVLPAVIRATSRAGPRGWLEPVWLYALNTLGGVLGLAVVVFLVLPRLGTVGTGLLNCAVNLLVAGGAVCLGWRVRESRTNQGREEPTSGIANEIPAPDMAFSRVMLLAFASGFLVLGLEVIAQHQFAQVTINSHFSGAVVLMLVLLALGLAAAVVPWVERRARFARLALPVSLFLALLVCLAQPFIFLRLQPGLDFIPYELPPAAYFFRLLCLGAGAILPVFLCVGLTFPLLLPGRAGNDSSVPSTRVGWLLAVNGLGGWLGAELAQNVVAPGWGIWRGVLLSGAGYLCLAWIAIPVERPDWWRVLVAGGGCALLLAWPAAGRLPQANLAAAERVIALGVGREGVVATVRAADDDWRILFNNTYSLGGSRAQANQERQGLLPLLLHGQPKRVALLGVATGSTTAGATLMPGVERIDAIELSALVLRFASNHFEPFNRGVFHDPRVHMIHEDARWVIASREHAYDVVIGDLFLPWRTGEGRLFTREHFQAVRRSLARDGLFCQWLPLFQLTQEQFRGIARTFQQVFPEAILVRGDFYTDLPIVGLVGGRDVRTLDWQRITSACATVMAAGQSRDPLTRHVEGVAMSIIGDLPGLGPGPTNTLGNGWLEWSAGWNVVGLRAPWFIGVPSAEFIRDIHRAAQPSIPENLRAAHDSGQFFLTLEVAGRANSPVLDNLRAQVPGRLPDALRRDAGANWSLWPARLKPLPAALGGQDP